MTDKSQMTSGNKERQKLMDTDTFYRSLTLNQTFWAMAVTNSHFAVEFYGKANELLGEACRAYARLNSPKTGPQ